MSPGTHGHLDTGHGDQPWSLSRFWGAGGKVPVYSQCCPLPALRLNPGLRVVSPSLWYEVLY